MAGERPLMTNRVANSDQLTQPSPSGLPAVIRPPSNYLDNMRKGTRPLGDVLEEIDHLDRKATIYVKNGIVDDSTESVVLAEGEEPPPGFKYLLEVYIAKEAIEVWSKWRDGKRPSRAERSAAVAHYASHDAYLPPEPAR
jgi:hypothetical protein